MSAGALARKFPLKGVLAAPHDGVRFEIDSAAVSDFYIAYRGTPDDLLRCGVVTAATLQHRSRNDRDEAVDSDGEGIRVKRRRGRQWVEVCRWKSRNLEAMPGFEPWMREVAQATHETLPNPSGRVRELSPELWRARLIGRLEGGVTFVVKSMRDGRAWDVDSLPAGLEPVAADVEAFERRAESMTDELASMIERMRISRVTSDRRGLRLVVDNTQRN
jgi:hypothetical protein